MVHFGIQGTFFGAAYAVFYYGIGHRYGALTIAVCTAVFALAPWLLRRFGKIGVCGHLLVGTMAGGFTQLSIIEGGIHSHAVAWLASVPLCGLLILGVRAASVWTAICFVVGMGISILDINGLEMAPLYDERWHDVVDAAGNLGIILFLFALGLVFEISRSTAFNRMKQSNDELAASNAELDHLNNEKTEFLGIAAHDLRNPLNSIIGLADLLTRNPDPKVVKRATVIAESGRHMLDLINDLLNANAIEEGQYATQLAACNLREIIAVSLQHQAPNSERKQIAVVFPDGPPCWAHADRKAALQVFDNLISNALKYSPPGSTVTVSIRQDPQFAEVAIKDQGPGISAEDQTKLFQKHTRLSARPTGGESSVGLGLSIVKRLVKSMDGEIECRSTLREGSTFALRLHTAEPPIEFSGEIRQTAATA